MHVEYIAPENKIRTELKGEKTEQLTLTQLIWLKHICANS